MRSRTIDRGASVEDKYLPQEGWIELPLGMRHPSYANVEPIDVEFVLHNLFGTPLNTQTLRWRATPWLLPNARTLECVNEFRWHYIAAEWTSSSRVTGLWNNTGGDSQLQILPRKSNASFHREQTASS
jgi:hypothetical protein